MTEPRCPRCNGKLMKSEEKLYWCAYCNMLTDGEDDGTVGYGRADRHAERKEEFEQRQKERLFRKFHGRRRGR